MKPPLQNIERVPEAIPDLERGKRILVPINLPNGSLDTLLFAKKMADQVAVRLTLLHVVRLNIAFASRIYDELCLESEEALRQIAKRFFVGAAEVDVSVRVGKPHEQIVAEAQSCFAELILLSSPKLSPWKRLLNDGTVKGVVRMAPCPTLVLPRSWQATTDEWHDAGRPSEGVAAPWMTTARA